MQGIRCEEKNRNKNKIEKQGTVREMESVVLNMSGGNCNETIPGVPKKTMPCLISCNVKPVKTISQK